MLLVLLISLFLLQLWLAFAPLKDSSHLASLWKRMIALTALTLLLLVLSSMSVKKQVLASEQVVLEHLEVPSEVETLTIQELYLFTKCFKVRLDPVAKVVCETEQLRCTIPSGILKLKISWC